MRSQIKWLLPLSIGAGLIALYLWPTPNVPFDQLYANVDPATAKALQSFRKANPPQSLRIAGATWEYVAVGQGPETLLFLHGMTGSYDIWWQQIEALQKQYRIISVTYPPVHSLGELEAGILAILDREGAQEFTVIGTSLGGYFAQYLMTQHPDRIRRAVLSNTFPPNNLIAEKNRALGAILPYLPEWLVLSVFRNNFQQTIYPTSDYDELTLAFLNEISYGRISKAQLVGRYHCVIEKFIVSTTTRPVLIIESDNDPLVELTLREQLKATYPTAKIYTFLAAGHFPYLNRAQEYTRLLIDFLRE
ncbi:alpha/beta fold hydrolase [uncultured Chloroflexus sp.]|uniref:alpha/beta fold hydrolase n=1 Tax=uncultured Chloroflexus sp. TaxID=214040 RepID=UPI0026204491|nr:alpha/beta hydrolase [uncultured Chloroflexus sp.]